MARMLMPCYRHVNPYFSGIWDKHFDRSIGRASESLLKDVQNQRALIALSGIPENLATEVRDQ
jgi:hypothetical protein